VLRPSVYNFRSNIIRCATNGFFFLALELNPCRQAKVAKLDLHVFSEEQVSKFQVPVDDFVYVNIFEGTENLNNITLDLDFMQPFPSLY